jgi:hypothetical protein
VEYLRRHAGPGQDSNPAKQSRIQLHVAMSAALVNSMRRGQAMRASATQMVALVKQIHALRDRQLSIVGPTLSLRQA